MSLTLAQDVFLFQPSASSRAKSDRAKVFSSVGTSTNRPDIVSRSIMGVVKATATDSKANCNVERRATLLHILVRSRLFLRTSLSSEIVRIQYMRLCALADPCSLMNNMGNGTQTHIRFFFDTNTGRCREFVYSGEGGNDNRFDSLQECKKVCLGATHTLPPSTSGLKKLDS